VAVQVCEASTLTAIASESVSNGVCAFFGGQSCVTLFANSRLSRFYATLEVIVALQAELVRESEERKTIRCWHALAQRAVLSNHGLKLANGGRVHNGHARHLPASIRRRTGKVLLHETQPCLLFTTYESAKL